MKNNNQTRFTVRERFLNHFKTYCGKTPIICVVFIVLVTEFGLLDVHSDVGVADGVVWTSIVRLLANPQEYSGKEVQIIGYYASGHEFRSIFLSSADARSGNLQAGIWVEFSEKPSDKSVNRRIKSGQVQIIGTFHCDPQKGSGHMGMWPGELRNVRFFQRRK